MIARIFKGSSARPIKDAREEQRQFDKRVRIGMLIIFLAFLGLASRYFYLQVLRHEDFSVR